MNRRSALKNLSSLAAASALPAFLQATDAPQTPWPGSANGPHLRKIATEEAFTIPEIAEAIRVMVKKDGSNLDLLLLKQLYAPSPPTKQPVTTEASQVANRDLAAKDMLPRLLDLDSIRLQNMDASGVHMHVLSLVMPGVQMFEPVQAAELASLANDRLSAAVLRHPTRFAGLAAFAPQDAGAAVREIERAINRLHLNGFIVNSHTANAYLDDARFSPILEAAEALQAPLYIHPRPRLTVWPLHLVTTALKGQCGATE